MRRYVVASAALTRIWFGPGESAILPLFKAFLATTLDTQIFQTFFRYYFIHFLCTMDHVSMDLSLIKGLSY